MNTEVLLNVIIPTYNQEKYVGQAIESVLTQVCDFDFQIIIGEDCSTDTTRIICESYKSKYPEKIVLLNNEKNLGLVRNYQRLLDACNAKYIAILEGDDYWIDMNKLQSQVEIMESNLEIGLVHTKSTTVYENGEIKVNHHLHHSDKSGFELYKQVILGKYNIVPLTACFRREIFNKYVDFDFCIKNKLITIDSFIWPELAMHTKFYFIDKVTGHYRLLLNSISNTKNFNNFNAWYTKGIMTLDYYKNKYPLTKGDEHLLYNNLGFLAIQVGLDNNETDFVLKNINLVSERNFKISTLIFIARYPYLHFLYPAYKVVINSLSRVKQIIKFN